MCAPDGSMGPALTYRTNFPGIVGTRQKSLDMLLLGNRLPGSENLAVGPKVRSEQTPLRFASGRGTVCADAVLSCAILAPAKDEPDVPDSSVSGRFRKFNSFHGQNN